MLRWADEIRIIFIWLSKLYLVKVLHTVTIIILLPKNPIAHHPVETRCKRECGK